jgi:hypothetical protein
MILWAFPGFQVQRSIDVMTGLSKAFGGLNFNPQDFNGDPLEAAYRTALGDGLEKSFEAGADSLADMAKGLNDRSVAGPDGKAWTEELLASELRRLAW